MYLFLPEKKLKLSEILYLNSRNYSKYFFIKKKKTFEFFLFKHGKNLFGCQIFKNLWIFDWFKSPEKNFIYFALSSKNTKKKNSIKYFDFIEVWQYSEKNKLKKKTLFCFENEDIWDFKWKKFPNKKKNLGSMALCCGFKIKIIEIPKLLPQFIKNLSPSFCINLIYIFQWKLSWECCQLATGDISGKIILFELNKNLSIKQIYWNVYKSSPLSTIKIFINKGKKLSRFLLSGSYDGVIKLWDLKNGLKPLFQLNLLGKRILDVSWYHLDYGNMIIWAALDNGFFSIISLTLNLLVKIQFGHQGGIWKTLLCKNTIFTVGEDGEINLIEFNSPYLFRYTPLNLIFSNLQNFRSNSRLKTFNLQIQSTGKKFSHKILSYKLIQKKKFILSVGGNSGVITFFKFFFD